VGPCAVALPFTRTWYQALGEHEDFFIIRPEDFPILQTLLALRVTRRNVYSSTRNRRSSSTVTV
jgi:hypothetical protein